MKNAAGGSSLKFSFMRQPHYVWLPVKEAEICNKVKGLSKSSP